MAYLFLGVTLEAYYRCEYVRWRDVWFDIHVVHTSCESENRIFNATAFSRFELHLWQNPPAWPVPKKAWNLLDFAVFDRGVSPYQKVLERQISAHCVLRANLTGASDNNFIANSIFKEVTPLSVSSYAPKWKGENELFFEKIISWSKNFREPKLFFYLLDND